MAKRVEAVYGRSGSGKTTWCLMLAEYIFQTTGKKTRWYLGDGGGGTLVSAGAIERGIVEIYQYNLRDNPLQTCRFITEGYWPKDPSDPLSPLVAPNYTNLDKDYGLFVIEGLSVMADYLMGDKKGGLSQQAGAKAKAIRDIEAKGQIIPEDKKRAMQMGGGIDSPYVVTDETGELVFGGVSMSGFGFVQRQMLDLVERSRILPGVVYWTAHEREIEAKDNDEGNIAMVGPDVAGKKLTSKIGASFGNFVHMHIAYRKDMVEDSLTKNKIEKLTREHRAYVKPHYDPNKKNYVEYYANNRAAPRGAHLMPEYFHPADPLAFYQKLQECQKEHEVAEARARLGLKEEVLI